MTLLASGRVFTDGRLGIEETDDTDDIEQNGKEVTGASEPRSETDTLSFNTGRVVWFEISVARRSVIGVV
ncbi:hypothetical protein ACFX2F_025341 [Malus domestica]